MKPTFTIKEIFAEAWSAVKQQIWVLVGLVIGYTIISLTLSLFTDSGLTSGLISIISLVVSSLFSLGYTRNIFQALDGEEPQFSAYGQESRKLLKHIVASILVSIVVAIGFILLIIPGIYLGIRLQFFTALIVDEDCDIIESIKRSWEITKGVETPLFLLFFTMIGITILGLILLGIGVFIAIPVCYTMVIVAYRKLNSPLNILEEIEEVV